MLSAGVADHDFIIFQWHTTGISASCLSRHLTIMHALAEHREPPDCLTGSSRDILMLQRLLKPTAGCHSAAVGCRQLPSAQQN